MSPLSSRSTFASDAMSLPSFVMASGLISSSIAPTSKKSAYSLPKMETNCPVTAAGISASLATRRPMNGQYPPAVLTQYFAIALGSFAATSSMSIPPIADAMTIGFLLARSTVMERYSSFSMSTRCSMRMRLAISPLIFMPKIACAGPFTSSASEQNLMPPAFPRPPTNTCAFTTDGAGCSRMICTASSTDAATRPCGTGMPALAKSSFPWYSRRRIRFSPSGGATCQSPPTLRGGAGVGGVACGPGAVAGLRRGARGAIVAGALVEPAEQLARNHDALYFGGAFVNLRDLGIAVVALRRELRRVAITAEDLQAFVGMSARGGRGEELRFRRCVHHRHASIAQPRRAVEQKPRSIEVDGHVRDLERHCLKRADRAPELEALLRVALRGLEARCEDADRLGRDTEPPRSQVRKRDLVARSFLGQQSRRFDARIFQHEIDGVRRMDAEFFRDATDAQALCLAVEQKCRDAFGPVAAGAREDHERAGEAAIGHPLLAPGDRIAIGAFFGARPQA